MRERINCQAVEIGLGDYLDDALPPGIRVRIASHLAGCPECAGQLHQVCWTVDHLRALRRPRVPPGLKASLTAAFRSARGPAARC